MLADRGQKGVLRELLTPGTYRIHPHAIKIAVEPEVRIPAGSVGIQTSLVGDPLPAGQLLAEREQKGVLREVLSPGTYWIHPNAAKIDVVPAVSIAAGFVGVQVAKTGMVPTGNKVLATTGERGVQKELLPPGMHFINPYEFDVIQADLRSQRYKMVDDDAVQFPSKDGFEIKIHVIIEWAIGRARASEVVATLGTEADIIEKVIRPNARSISRTEGSKYVAKDFIVGAGREQFQAAFFASLANIAKPKGIIVHRALVLTVIVPEPISAPIKQAVIAEEENLRNLQQIKTARSSADLAFELSVAQQNERKVEAATKKLERQVEAEAAAEELGIEATARVNVASLALEASRLEAQSILETGRAQSEVIRMKVEAQATGLAAGVKAFGDGKAFAMYEFASKLSPNIQVVFAPAGEGTLWTSLDEFFRIGASSKILEEAGVTQTGP